MLTTNECINYAKQAPMHGNLVIVLLDSSQFVVSFMVNFINIIFFFFAFYSISLSVCYYSVTKSAPKKKLGQKLI